MGSSLKLVSKLSGSMTFGSTPENLCPSFGVGGVIAPAVGSVTWPSCGGIQCQTIGYPTVVAVLCKVTANAERLGRYGDETNVGQSLLQTVHARAGIFYDAPRVSSASNSDQE